jgi:hypothetical protein
MAVRPSIRIMAACADAAASAGAAIAVAQHAPAAAWRAADEAGGRDVHAAFRFVRRHHRRTVVAVVSTAMISSVPDVGAPPSPPSRAPSLRAADVPEYPPALLS